MLVYPMISAYACTLLKNNSFDIEFIDAVAMRLSKQDFLKELTNFNPDLVFMETKTPTIKYIWRVAAELKSVLPKVKITLCGDHVSALPRESLKRCGAIDYVAIGGDFDTSALKLAMALKDGTKFPAGVWYRNDGGITTSGPSELMGNLDSLPYIDRVLVPWWLYHESWRLYDEFFYIMSGRGCYAQCSFCSWPATLYNYCFRLRSPENVVEEIKHLIKRYRAKEIFDDLDTWPARSKWAKKFCQLMIREELNEEVMWSVNARASDLQDLEMLKLMKKAGCRVLKIGVESASQETLDRIKKQVTIEQIRNAVMLCKRVGLTVHLTAMFGYPWETREDALKTIKFIKSLKPDSAQFSIVTPYPGTELFKEALEKGWFRIDPKDWEKFDMSQPVLKSVNMASEEVLELCVRAWRSVYFSPLYIARRIWGVRSWRHIKLLLRGTKVVMRAHIGGLEKGRT